MNNVLTVSESIIVVIGSIMAWPWLFTMSRSFGRALIVAIYPKKSVILEIEEEDGSIVRKTVKLSSDEELVKMILSHEKIRVMD